MGSFGLNTRAVCVPLSRKAEKPFKTEAPVCSPEQMSGCRAYTFLPLTFRTIHKLISYFQKNIKKLDKKINMWYIKNKERLIRIGGALGCGSVLKP